MKWMLANGADPELLGGWPATRAIITAAFVGEPAYVLALGCGAKLDRAVDERKPLLNQATVYRRLSGLRQVANTTVGSTSDTLGGD